MQTIQPAPENDRAKANDSILWFALLSLAALLRLGPIASGLPYIDYVDEGHILHPATGILKSKNFDSSIYTYPPLTSYLTIAAIKVYSPVYRMVHQRELKDDLPSDQDSKTSLGDHYDLIVPPEIIWLGRLVIACLSIGTVILAGALAKLLGGARAGLLAMLFAALCPALVSRGSNLALDPTGAFFVIAALYFCQRLRIAARATNKPAMWRHAAFAAIASGLAFGAKFTAVAVFAALLVTIATLPLAWRSKALLIMIAGGGLFVGVFCGIPGAVLHPEKIVGELRYITKFYQTIQSEHGYWRSAFSASEVGVPLMISGLAGLLWMLWRPSTRKVAASWLAFGLLMVSAFTSSSFKPFRNLLPLVPLLCIAAALLCIWMEEYLEQRQRRLAFASWLVAAFVLLIALSLGWSSARHLKARTQRIDTRVRAINWLQQQAAKEATVLGIRELAILPVEWKRIAANAIVVPWFEAADLLERQRFDYIVTGEFDLRYATDPNAWSAYRDRWNAKTSPLRVEATFGEVATPVVPYLWRTNDERILILRGNAE
ncbi:MAG: phospholipid carrier-dependent glycosyltransferase [Verrucomicrobiaceae bacterium]|nr:phospholipid carrier-dependent glycosyltransferase [Verrucomicrobiaceae bacterium]